MDFPVEATVLLDEFQDEREVRKILRSHGFQMKDLERGQVRVNGYFFMLKEAKAKLDQLPKSQTKMSPYSSSPVPAASSGAISKNYNRRDKPPHSSPSSPTTPPSSAPGSSHRRPDTHTSSPDQRGSLSHGEESFVTDADVFKYADQFTKRNINSILIRHGVKMRQQDCGDMFNITLMGKNSKTAMAELQRLMDHLSKSLRTQEVPLKDMNRNGTLLLKKIQQNGNIDGSVLVCEMSNSLHLIGLSRESYELKQRLLDRPIDQSGRTGRTSAKSSRGRSSSAPPINRKSTETAANPDPSPGGATGYSPSKYQDDKQEDAATGQGAAALYSRGRSQSVSRENKDAKRVNGNLQERENKPPSQKLPMKMFKNLINFNTDNIKQKFKIQTKKK